MLEHWIPLLFFSVFLGIGLLMLAGGVRDIYRAWSSQWWESTKGEILEAQLKVEKRRSNKRLQNFYEVKTKYTYDVYGRIHQGEHIGYSYQQTSTEQHHQALLERLQSARQVQVHYDPVHPERSALVIGFDRSRFTLLILALMWLLFTGGMACMFWLILGGDLAIAQSIVVPR